MARKLARRPWGLGPRYKVLTNAELRNANFRRNARAARVKPSLHTKDWYYGLSKIWTVDCLTRGRGSKCLEHLQPIMD